VSDSDESGGFSIPGVSLTDLTKTLSAGATAGAASIVKNAIKQKTVETLTDHGHEELERYITVRYPLVQEELPDRVKQLLGQYGPQHQDMILAYISPEKVLYWMENPDWVPEDETDVRDELQACADTIRSTPGGEEWLNQQVLHLYQIANIVPED
jgi:hypothetical protein